ncbi:putative membrane protein [Massilia sp. UYP11]|uniref:DUF2339 domain-containing protein n=1 Tax=Massilia sp. UYP11 TaxID=1756385 RepID=UPI003D219DCE
MHELGFVVLAILGYPFLVAWLMGLSKASRIAELEGQVAALNRRVQRLMMPSSPIAPAGRPADEAAVPTPLSDLARTPPPAPAADDTIAPSTPRTTTTILAPEPVKPTRPRAAPTVHEEPVREPYLKSPPRWLIAARTWLLTGNLVAKLGLVILFIGIGFLLKYAATTLIIPIELRLAAVVLADFGLLAWGWRLRLARRELALPIQGTAIAVLMLVIFSAYRLYALIPSGLAFALLVFLTAFTCLLAVLQEAPWLAAFGITGGFASPVLLASGEAGSHIALFTYYALLNAGVFALAFMRSWHPLNLLGFVFTFIIGAAWGGLRYTPEHYWSAQAFLILFFLCYVAIPLAFATRERTRMKDYVDITLVLGTPLLAFGFQVGLVREMEFGLAFTALGLGGFYLALGILLWRSGKERLRLMVETFAVVGVIFGTLAVPFALDARWTSAAWAVEGAGFVWLGLRSQRRLAWSFGLFLQVGAWVSFIAAASKLDVDTALAANLWLGFLLLGCSAFLIAANLRKHAGKDDSLPELASVGLLLAAVALLGACWSEAVFRADGSTLANWMVAGALFTAVLLYAIGVSMAWPMARGLALAAQVAGAAAVGIICAPGWSFTSMLETSGEQPLLGVVMLAVAAFATSRMLQRVDLQQGDANHPTSGVASALLLWAGIWWFGPVINIAAGRIADYLPAGLGSQYARWTCVYAAAVVITAVVGMRLGPRLAWPQLRWFASACWGMLALVTAASLHTLYASHTLPEAAGWLAWAILLAGGEYAMLRWSASGPEIRPIPLRLLHVLRTAGPWLAIWPAGAILIDRWLAGPSEPLLAAHSDWASDAAWSNYLPSWAMMLALVFLLRRSQADRWPSAPLADWYRTVIIPSGTVLMAMLAVFWNVGHDGAMSPLPYVPLLNPLDLTTGFVLMLWANALRQLTSRPVPPHALMYQLKIGGAIAAYIWFNLILLRSAAHYGGIDYRLDALAASQSVQAMLSLVWSASALVLMRFSARMTMRRAWWGGALALGIVVAKLFLVDLANGGSIARVVSFVGVGLLLLLVGYLAPYPKTAQAAPSAVSA